MREGNMPPPWTSQCAKLLLTVLLFSAFVPRASCFFPTSTCVLPSTSPRRRMVCHPAPPCGKNRVLGCKILGVRAALSDPSFDAWLDSCQVRRSALKLAEFDGGIRGVQAAEDISAGDIVLSIPLSACLVDGPALDPMVGIEPGAWECLPWQCRMSLKLAMERARGKQSHYHAYISSLPQEPPVPLARWSEQELEQLQDPYLQAEADSLLFWSTGLYDDIIMLSSDTEMGSIPDRDAFMWALDTLQSRTIRLDEGIDLGGAGVIRALVPLLDMCNHKPGCKTRFFLDESGERVQLEIGYSVEKGDQVYLNYGDKDNEHLINFYGFVLPNNPHDQVLLRPIITNNVWRIRNRLSGGADELKQQRLEEYCQKLPAEDSFIKLGLVSGKVLDAYTLLCASESDIAALDERWERVLEQGVRSVCQSDGICGNERIVAAVLAKRLRMELASYPTSISEDAELLARISLSSDSTEDLLPCNKATERAEPGALLGVGSGVDRGRLICAVQLRSSKKKLLLCAAEALEAFETGAGIQKTLSIEQALAQVHMLVLGTVISEVFGGRADEWTLP